MLTWGGGGGGGGEKIFRNDLEHYSYAEWHPSAADVNVEFQPSLVLFQM